MKIQIVPETELERQKIETIEHTGIKEFMLFGKKIDADGMGVDIHEWTGSYRYLIGSMEFFTEVLHDERRERNSLARKEDVIRQLEDESKKPPELKIVGVDGGPAPEPSPAPEVDQVEDDQAPSK